MSPEEQRQEGEVFLPLPDNITSSLGCQPRVSQQLALPALLSRECQTQATSANEFPRIQSFPHFFLQEYLNQNFCYSPYEFRDFS